VGCPKASSGGVSFVYTYENDQVWVQKDFFVYSDFYLQENARLGESSAAQPGDDGIIAIGYGLNGEVYSYSKDC
jgi:hypothetical protein